MTNAVSVISICIIAIILTEVTSWTIDLPEVRKYYFERNNKKRGNENKIYFNNRLESGNYNNIEGNSLLNSPHRHEGVNGGRYDGNGVYADDYGYNTYMEKKVHGIFHNGSVYLEGLRRAMERYSDQLENCTKLERSRPPSNRTWVPESDFPQQSLSSAESAALACGKVTRETEHVRRLASLVVWAIRELQDIAYAKDYDKETKESEEDVLLLQLAWALDELARLTGYEPDPSDFTTVATPAPAPTATPPTFFNLPIPNDGPTMANCLKDKNTAVPATVRCAVPVPPIVLQFLNWNSTAAPGSAADTDNPTGDQEVMSLLALFNSTGTEGGQQAFDGLPAAEVRRRMRGCLAGAAPHPASCRAFISFMQFLNDTFPQLHLQRPLNFQTRPNREAESSQLEILQAAEDNLVVPLRKFRGKRSADQPMKQFAKYYLKYKTWSHSNPADGGTSENSTDGYDVDNDLTAAKTVRKRSVNVKDWIVVRIPEDPMQDLSSYVKHKSGVRYTTDAVQAEKIKMYLEKMYHSNGATAKQNVRKLDKLIKSVHKRSVHYGRLHRPRVPEDPMQDISYYVKRKAGTRTRPDAEQAARVRLGLRAIFERGNIEVVHRYGSNYIPGVQPIVVGAVASFSDV